MRCHHSRRSSAKCPRRRTRSAYAAAAKAAPRRRSAPSSTRSSTRSPNSASNTLTCPSHRSASGVRSTEATVMGPEASSQGRIPVLDIGAYLAGEAGAAAPLARAIARTCEDTGFLVVANHGVPQHLVDDTFAVAQQFFARPEGDKLALKIGTYNIGYLPFGGQVVRHSPVNKNTRPNFSESFYITRDRAPDHPDIVNEKPLVGLNRWPEDMPEFRAATTAYYRAMEAMTTRLVPLFALALDLPADYFSAAFAEPNGTIRLIHYPPHPSPDHNEFGFAPHTDNNFITFLAQSKLPGLEVRTAEGDWIRPPAVPGP